MVRTTTYPVRFVVDSSVHQRLVGRLDRSS
jgi:hypothetical protein